MTPVKTYMQEDIGVSSGTDSPVVPYNPFWALYHVITRETVSAGGMGEEERIRRMEALRLSTIEVAYLTFEEAVKGSIEVGKLADLAVLSRVSCTEKEIEEMEVLMTIVGGAVVYNRADRLGL